MHLHNIFCLVFWISGYDHQMPSSSFSYQIKIYFIKTTFVLYSVTASSICCPFVWAHFSQNHHNWLSWVPNLKPWQPSKYRLRKVLYELRTVSAADGRLSTQRKTHTGEETANKPNRLQYVGNNWDWVSLPLQSLAGPICVIIESKPRQVNLSPQQPS